MYVPVHQSQHRIPRHSSAPHHQTKTAPLNSLAVQLDGLLPDNLDRPDVVRPRPLEPLAAAPALLLQGGKPFSCRDEDTTTPTTTVVGTDDRSKQTLPSHRLHTSRTRVRSVSAGLGKDRATYRTSGGRTGALGLRHP